MTTAAAIITAIVGNHSPKVSNPVKPSVDMFEAIVVVTQSLVVAFHVHCPDLISSVIVPPIPTIIATKVNANARPPICWTDNPLLMRSPEIPHNNSDYDCSSYDDCDCWEPLTKRF